MSINLITYPNDVPVSIDDWQNNIKLHDAVLLQQEEPWRIDWDNDDVMQGSVFQIQGAIYQADADTAITGTASNYVKITPAGTTASAAYVANLTGVSWSNIYKGYYDGSGNLYVFDEIKAIAAGVISAEKTKIGRAYKSLLGANNAFTGNNDFTGTNTFGNIDGATFTAKPAFNKGFKINDSLSGTKTQDEIFAALNSYVPTNGDTMPIFGGWISIAGSPGSYRVLAIANYCERINSTTIRFYYARLFVSTSALSSADASIGTIDAVSGGSTFFLNGTKVQMAW